MWPRAAHRASLAVATIAVSLTALASVSSADTTVETNASLQLVPNSEHTEPDVHSVQFQPQTIEVKTDGVTTVSFETSTIVDVGKIVVGDLIINTTLTLQNWNTGIDPLVFNTQRWPPWL